MEPSTDQAEDRSVAPSADELAQALRGVDPEVRVLFAQHFDLIDRIHALIQNTTRAVEVLDKLDDLRAADIARLSGRIDRLAEAVSAPAAIDGGLGIPEQAAAYAWRVLQEAGVDSAPVLHLSAVLMREPYRISGPQVGEILNDALQIVLGQNGGGNDAL